MKTDDHKTLYAQYYVEKYREFIRSNDEDKNKILSLPAKHWWSPTSGETDTYERRNISGDVEHKALEVVEKNKHPHAFLWTTTPKKIKQGVRWGIIKAESITGQVIHTLGHYRMRATERVASGMMSDTQGIKIALLDLYQDRFEALQDMESLVNKDNNVAHYKTAIEAYKINLEKIKATVKQRFADLHLKELGYASLPCKILTDLDEDIAVAEAYLKRLEQKKFSLREANRARGNDSILEFVKQQMHRNLYELQGLNQGVVFSLGALTRGELNDHIEDARKVIDDHQPDLRNPVTRKHHGDFTDKFDTEKNITHEFSLHDMTYEQEREALLAVSFIENWNSVDYVNKIVHNNVNKTTAPLIKISATKWNTHRNIGRAIWEYAKNWVIGILYPTRPWHEGVTDDGVFRLHAETLLEHTRLHDPLWIKGFSFLRDVIVTIKVVATGAYHAGVNLVFNFFEDIENDWHSSFDLPAWDDVQKDAEQEISTIVVEEKERLEKVFEEANHERIPDQKNLRTLTEVEFHLNSGEYSDLMNALANGFGGFVEHFTHELFNKDPVGGTCFTAAFVTGGACVLFPVFSKTYFIPPYFKFSVGLSKLVGASVPSQAMGGGFTQAQLASLMNNTIVNGPDSNLAHGMKAFADNPIPAMVGFLAAYGVGYALANMPIPYLHELIKGELGSSEILNYPVIGVKFGIMSIMLVYTDEKDGYKEIEIPYKKLDNMVTRLISVTYKDDAKTAVKMHEQHERFQFQRWLNNNASMLPKLSTKAKFEISRQIDKLFDRDEALSLRKLIYPPKERSIGYQFFAVPLSYIPAIFRLVSSMVSSAVAWMTEKPNYEQPVIQAGKALWRNIAKDLTRPCVAAGRFLRAITAFLASNFKAIFFIGAMLTERMAAFGHTYRPGHYIYKEIAYPIHALYSAIGEFLFPVRAMKSVVSKDPAAIMHKTLGSYKGMMKEMNVNLDDYKKDSHIDDDQDGKQKIIVEYVEPGADEKQNLIQEQEFPRDNRLQFI